MWSNGTIVELKAINKSTVEEMDLSGFLDTDGETSDR